MKFDPNKSVKRLNHNIQHDSVLLRTPSARRRRKLNSDYNETTTMTSTESIQISSENVWPTLEKCLICRNSDCIGNKCCEYLNMNSPTENHYQHQHHYNQHHQHHHQHHHHYHHYHHNHHHYKKQNVKRKDKLLSPPSLCTQCSFESSSQVRHNQQHQEHNHQRSNNNKNNNNNNQKHHNQQQQIFEQKNHHQHQQFHQYNQERYCNSTNSRCSNWNDVQLQSSSKELPFCSSSSFSNTSLLSAKSSIPTKTTTISSLCSSSSQKRKGCNKLLLTKDTKTADTRWSAFLLTSLLVGYTTPTTTNTTINTKCDTLSSNCSKKYMRTLTSKIPLCFFWFAISFFLVNFSINLVISGAYAKEIKPRLRSSGKVCPSLDIRNGPSEFRNLSECSVIEGFLIISLMDKYSPQDYEMSFPLLTEITDYMLVYRVNGLKTLGRLFPNLTVIRGNILFEGYALVVYENIHLEEVALTSLTTIKRGAVRIEKNPLLCFVETIEWAQIAINTSVENHFFRNNKVINECPSCPGGNSKSDRAEGGHQMEEGKSCTEYPGGYRYCWNRQHCQKICPARCKNSCNNRGECCNESCLGGCAHNNVNSCSVCKHLVYGNECTETCPEKSYKYLERSCINAQECFSKLPPLNADMRHEYPYVPFRGVCSSRCPSGYEKFNNETCRRCDDKCVKKCPPSSLDSISDARRLRGCTVISGSLIISIRQGGPHIMEDLENALSSIEEIEGYLKVTRSFSLLSLSFLKGLKVIRGNELDSSKYALYVLDNQNLQNIWGDNQTVKIDRGRIFFHFNPKLCYYKIENLRSMMADITALDKSEVATDSNGDRGSCNITTLNVTVTQVGSRAAIVKVQPMIFDDDRGFIGYQYYYIEALFRNVSIYDSRHGCGNDGWNLDDDNSKDTDHIFTHLKPYTQYAFYVKTYTISTETNNGQSPIIYFRTLPDKPEPVRNLRSLTNSSSEVIVKWSPPRVANGNLTMYVIKANLTLDDPKLLEQRNYCDEPIKETYEVPTIIQPGKDGGIGEKDAKDCMCDDQDSRGSKTATKIEEAVVVNVINFEDAIQNFIYVKREDLREKKSVRRKRDLDNITITTTDTSTDSGDRVFPNYGSKHSEEIDPKEITISKKEGTFYTYIYAIVNTSVQELVLKNLKHYTTYTISVKACREGFGDRCSNEAITYSRTSKLGGADNVENFVVRVVPTNMSRSDVRLKWEPPKDPNSLILSYSIRYVRADIEHAKGVDQCITQRGYTNLTNGYFSLTNLETGNYSVQVMATSLAGDGNYTIPVYFYIPEKSISWQVILAICLTSFLLLVLIVVLVWYIRKKYVAAVPDLKLFTSVNPEYVSMHYTPDEWEIPRDKIIQLRELGQGSFGMVYEGIVKNLNKIEEDTPCAIKTVNESATDRERINFLNEASVMKEFDTHHVVRLLGVCSRGQPTLVVMELMKFGDLKAYLRSHRPDAESLKAGDPPPQPPTLKRILQMAIEIADGMAYLSAKKFVHRDLAARNCMVAADLTVKIGDFGMTRDIYETDYYRKGTKGLLPVRWMAPESLKDGVFSSTSDVFSYGVVLWEMATLASQPYQGLSNDQVLRYVIDGGVMERPENCPDKLYNLMRKCWQHRPSSRPSFMEIIQALLDDAEPKFREVSFYHSQEGQDVIAQMQPPTDLDDVTTPLRVGDDDFKMEIDDNYLNNSKHSRRSVLAAATEGQPHSPYSFGSAILTSSTPGAETSLKRSSQNSLSSLNQEQQKQKQQQQQQTFPVQSISSYYPIDGNNPTTIPEAVTATPPTTGTVQNFFNSLSAAPRSRRMDFLRNAFLGNGNSNKSSNNRQQINSGNGGGNIYGKAGTSTEAAAAAAAAGTGNISTIVNPNEYNNSGKNGNFRKTSKDYQILNESALSTENPIEEMKVLWSPPPSNYEQLSLPSLFSQDKRIQQPKQQRQQQQQQQPQQQLQNQQKQQQCNELDSKVTNSRRNSNKLRHSTSKSSNSAKDTEKMSTTMVAAPYQFPQKTRKLTKESGIVPSRSTPLQQPNGYIIASPQGDYSVSQDYQDGISEEQELLTKSHK